MDMTQVIKTPPIWMRVLVGRRPAATFVRLVLMIGTSIVVFGFWLMPVRASGPSMLPTFGSGSLKFVNTLAYTWGAPARGDIVAIRMAGPSVVYVKRVVGLPGERLQIAGGVVFVNGRSIEEPYVKYRARWVVKEFQLGADEYFVVGDNRGMRVSDHDFGVARRQRIVGKILF